MQPQNNNNIMNSISGETKYFTIISKDELKSEAFIMLDTIFSFLQVRNIIASPNYCPHEA